MLNHISLIIVALLWGATNPFIRRGSIGVENIKETSTFRQFFAELLFLATRWQYLLPFVLNQCGSLLYVIALQTTELSLAVPVANSLSFVFTAISARLLGEQKASLKTYIGMILVMAGTMICMFDKIKNAT